ncbi:MAG: GNAT family N-acetyltransferase [Ferruginibacter sp.]
MQIILQTPRLYLRQFSTADAALLYQLNSQADVLKYLHERPLKDETDAAEIIRSIILPQYEKKLGRWGMFIKETNEFIGWCGLKYRPELNETDLGYRLMPPAWGKGFATEAAHHCLQYGFEKLQLTQITGRAHIENLASIKVLEKIGMKFLKEEVVDDCPVKTYIASQEHAW